MHAPQQVVDDLRYVFNYFPLRSLMNVRASRHRLIRGEYRRDGKGCLFNLLSELLPVAERITTREELTRFFTGFCGEFARELPQYQPARWLVRLVDGHDCNGRYGKYQQLEWDVVMACLDQVIAERQAREAESARVERRALKAARQRRAMSIR